MLPSRSGILAEAINTKILTKNHPDSPHSHPDSPHSHLYSPHSHPHSPHSHSDSPHSHLDSSRSHPDFRRSHPDSPYSVPRFPILAFTDSQLFLTLVQKKYFLTERVASWQTSRVVQLDWLDFLSFTL